MNWQGSVCEQEMYFFLRGGWIYKTIQKASVSKLYSDSCVIQLPVHQKMFCMFKAFNFKTWTNKLMSYKLNFCAYFKKKNSFQILNYQLDILFLLYDNRCIFR